MLSDLFKIGSSKRVLKAQWQTSGVPFYRGREITKLSQNGFVDNDLFISEELYAEYATKHGVPTAGDIVITAIGTIGNSYIVREEDRFYFKDASVLWLKRTSDVESKYINLWLKSSLMREQLDEGNGATVDTLTIKKLQGLTLDIPPVPEQKRIVALLDTVFADLEQTRAKTEQNLKNAAELFDSYLNDAFENNFSGVEHDSLNDICELIVDCEHKTAPKQETGYPSIRTPNIGKGVLILEGVNRVSEETYITWTRRAIPQEDDLILAREAPAGNIGVIPKNVKVCLGQRTVLIRPKKDKFLSKYLAFLILSQKVQKQLLSHSTGATVQHINMKDIRAFKIYNLPSLVEQQKVINGIDKILKETKKLEAIYSQKIDNLEELKKSILQKAFSGELTHD